MHSEHSSGTAVFSGFSVSCCIVMSALCEGIATGILPALPLKALTSLVGAHKVPATCSSWHSPGATLEAQSLCRIYSRLLCVWLYSFRIELLVLLLAGWGLIDTRCELVFGIEVRLEDFNVAPQCRGRAGS